LGPSGPVVLGWEVRHSIWGFLLIVASSRLGWRKS
jgi:hypothetical protein